MFYELLFFFLNVTNVCAPSIYRFWLSFPYLQEEFEDTKGVMRICNLKKDRQHNGQIKKYKQRSTKHYTEN
jgi:hypothetical protein